MVYLLKLKKKYVHIIVTMLHDLRVIIVRLDLDGQLSNEITFSQTLQY